MSEISKLNPLNSGPLSDKKNEVTEKKFREVSELYEKHFIREMMKQMRATVHEGGFIQQNNAEKIFRDQMDDQYSDQWSKAGGIGLSSIIYDQLMQKYGNQFGLTKPIEKPQGPIDFNSKSNFNGMTIKNPLENSSSTAFKFTAEPGQKLEIKNPWVGTLLDKKYLEMDQMQYQIKHDNGLESLILTQGTGLGQGLQLSQGDTIKSGEQIGWLNSASPLFWKVQPIVSE